MDRYVPAAGRWGSTQLYDRTVALTMREERWRPRLVRTALASVAPGGRVVEVGAGTGTVALALAAQRPDVEVVAVDGDPEALAIARAKPGAGRVRWVEGLAGELDLAGGCADAVVMSLVLHHLSPAAKRAALTDVARVLAPGAALHVADWGRPATPLMRAAGLTLGVFDGQANLRDHLAGRLPDILRESFASVERHARIPTAWGTLELLQASTSVSRSATKPG